MSTGSERQQQQQNTCSCSSTSVFPQLPPSVVLIPPISLQRLYPCITADGRNYASFHAMTTMTTCSCSCGHSHYYKRSSVGSKDNNNNKNYDKKAMEANKLSPSGSPKVIKEKEDLTQQQENVGLHCQLPQQQQQQQGQELTTMERKGKRQRCEDDAQQQHHCWYCSGDEENKKTFFDCEEKKKEECDKERKKKPILGEKIPKKGSARARTVTPSSAAHTQKNNKNGGGVYGVDWRCYKDNPQVCHSDALAISLTSNQDHIRDNNTKNKSTSLPQRIVVPMPQRLAVAARVANSVKKKLLCCVKQQQQQQQCQDEEKIYSFCWTPDF